MDTIYQRMNDETETLDDEKPPSEIQEFYRGKTIFLTGCTGFIGKCLTEKLLRTCWEMKKLYILVRPKKNVESDERMRKYFSDVIFEPLKKTNPNFMRKVDIISGDLLSPGINLSPKDRQLLIETVDVIIHNASIVIFSTKISKLFTVNVLGVKEMLDLASECHHLKCFMYVSTAYSHCYMQTVEEKFYQEPGDLKMVQDMIKADLENEAGLNPDTVETMLHPFPNAYIFSKAVAESIVQDYVKKLPFPCGVFRMSIVISSYKEPVTGWCANLNGPAFAIATAGLGLLHVTFYMEDEAYDVVPADMTANGCLVAVWDLAEHRQDCREGVIYNYGSSAINPVGITKFIKQSYELGVAEPSIRTLWKYFVINCTNYRSFMIYHVLIHYIPAILLDIIFLLRLKKPKITPFLWKMEKTRRVTFYFFTKSWEIKVDQMTRIWDRMNPTDSKLFFSDLRKLDWDDYTSTYWRGIRVYLLKDPMDTLEKAKRKYKKLERIHYIVVVALLLLVSYIFFKIADALFL